MKELVGDHAGVKAITQCSLPSRRRQKIRGGVEVFQSAISGVACGKIEQEKIFLERRFTKKARLVFDALFSELDYGIHGDVRLRIDRHGVFCRTLFKLIDLYARSAGQDRTIDKSIVCWCGKRKIIFSFKPAPDTPVRRNFIGYIIGEILLVSKITEY